LLKTYGRSAVLSFFEVYVAKNAEYLPYLSASYDAYLSQDQKFKVYLISGASEPALKQAIEDFRAREGTLAEPGDLSL
jgi:hypothetical protein